MNIEHFITFCRQSPQSSLRDHEVFRRDFLPYTLGSRLRASRTLSDYQYNTPKGTAFADIHHEAWATLLTNLAHWEEGRLSLKLPQRERIFIAGWYFPTIPLLFSFAKQINALLLVSQDAPWLASLKESGCTLNIREREASLQLKQNMEAGRIIAGMLDHYLPDIRSFQETKLLGRTVKTPSGVLDLCSRYNYHIIFIAPRNDGIEVVAETEAAGMSASELAQQYNDWLEVEIRRTPEQWLMWQALPSH